jgi:hypothetical protein
MPSPIDAQLLCEALDAFAIPAALADLAQNRFIGWNRGMLDVLCLDERAIAQIRAKECISFEWPPPQKPADCAASPASVQFVACALRPSESAHFALGQAFKREDDLALIVGCRGVDQDKALRILDGLRDGAGQERQRLCRELTHLVADDARITIETAKQLQASSVPSTAAQSDLQTIVEAIDHLARKVDTALTNEQPSSAPHPTG